MNELEEPRVTPAPTCWEETKPEAFPDKAEYWACEGLDIPCDGETNETFDPSWRCLCYSKEEAEAFASTPCKEWVWNKQEAKAFPLKGVMLEVRQDGDKGVRVLAYVDGEWITVKEYSANQPLPEHLR